MLEFRSTNTVHAPVLEALELIKRYKADVARPAQCYAAGEHVPVDGSRSRPTGGPDVRGRQAGPPRSVRTVYECGVFQALREKLRCKEIWVVGADKWRNPDEDLPADFEAAAGRELRRARASRWTRAQFIDQMRRRSTQRAGGPERRLPRPAAGWRSPNAARPGRSSSPRWTPLPEPRNLRRLKTAIRDRWGMVPLIDMLKETVLRTGCLDAFTPAGRPRAPSTARCSLERLLLLVYAYGTNTGIRAVAAGEHGHTEDDLRYVRRRYLTVEACRQVARVRSPTPPSPPAGPALWGEGTTAVASDSTHFAAFDQNIFTEWHSRYRRPRAC